MPRPATTSRSRTDTCTTDVEWYREQAERAGITRWSRPDLVPIVLRETGPEYRRAWAYFCFAGHRFTAPDPPALSDFSNYYRTWIERSAPANLNGGWR